MFNYQTDLKGETAHLRNLTVEWCRRLRGSSKWSLTDENHHTLSAGQWYRQLNPQSWTTDNVLEWISDHVESTKFDASSLSLAQCAVDGHTLCQMTQDQMIGAFGVQLGPRLYQSLQEHKTKYGKPSPVMCEIKKL